MEPWPRDPAAGAPELIWQPAGCWPLALSHSHGTRARHHPPTAAPPALIAPQWASSGWWTSAHASAGTSGASSDLLGPSCRAPLQGPRAGTRSRRGRTSSPAERPAPPLVLARVRPSHGGASSFGAGCWYVSQDLFCLAGVALSRGVITRREGAGDRQRVLAAQAACHVEHNRLRQAPSSQLCSLASLSSETHGDVMWVVRARRCVRDTRTGRWHVDRPLSEICARQLSHSAA